MSVLLALFSALGAVLLFLLKLVGILLLIDGFIGAGTVLPVLCRCAVGAGRLHRKGRGTGPCISGVPVSKTSAHGTRRTQGPAWQTESKIPRLACGTQSEKGGGKSSKTRKAQKRNISPQKAKLTLNIICTMLRGAGRLTRAIFGALRFTKIRICLGVRGEDPAQAARTYGKLNAWLYTSLGVLDRFLFLDFEELRLLPDFGSAEPTVEDRVSFRVSARLFFIVCAAVRVLYEFWREKVLDVFI